MSNFTDHIAEGAILPRPYALQDPLLRGPICSEQRIQDGDRLMAKAA